MKVTAKHIDINTSFDHRFPQLTIEFAIKEIEDRDELNNIQNLLGVDVELNLPRRIQKCSSRR